jgi:hypothetical protein
MIDYTLKFPDECSATQVLEPFVATHSIDVIGVIYEPTGEMIDTPDGPSSVMAAILGWHVNVRGPESESLAQYNIEVTTPVRVWA